MAVFQVGQQAVKPSAIGEVTRGFQALEQGKRRRQMEDLQSKILKLKLEDLQTQIEQRKQPPAQIPREFEQTGITIGEKGGVSRRFAPLAKPKKFDIIKLNDILFKITHTKDKKGKAVEIEPNKSDLISLRLAAKQSGYELRRVPKTFAKVGRFGKVIPPTYTYRLIPKKKIKQPSVQRTGIDVKKLTDAQLDSIIGSK